MGPGYGGSPRCMIAPEGLAPTARPGASGHQHLTRNLRWLWRSSEADAAVSKRLASYGTTQHGQGSSRRPCAGSGPMAARVGGGSRRGSRGGLGR